MLLSAIFVAISFMLQTAVAQDRVKEIRKIYADALEAVKMMKEEPHSMNLTEVKSKATHGGVGMVEETITYYSELVYNTMLDEAPGEVYMPRFVRTKKVYNEALSGTATSEYVFDTQTGNLVFCFMKSTGYEGDMNLHEEQRFYFNQDGSLCTKNAVVKKTADNSQVTTFEANDEVALKEALYLKDLFNSLMNRNIVKTSEKPVMGSADLTFFDLQGPVKRAKTMQGDLDFDRNGRLVLFDGVDPFRPSGPSRTALDDEGSFVDNVWLQRNAQGQICGKCYYEYASDFEISPEGRIMKEISFGEGMCMITTYNYDAKGRLISKSEQEVDPDMANDEYKPVGEPTTTHYSYSDYDRYGNWTKCKVQDDSWERVIEYY